MPDLEVEVMLKDHPHLFLVEVESVLEAQQLQGTSMECKICKRKGVVERVGIPSRKNREPRPMDDRQKSMFE